MTIWVLTFVRSTGFTDEYGLKLGRGQLNHVIECSGYQVKCQADWEYVAGPHMIRGGYSG